VPKNPKKTATNAKRQMEVLDRDLYHLREIRRRYSNRVLKVGLVSWVVGVITFTISVIFWIGTDLLFQRPGLWLPFLIIALAAPIVISAVLIRRLVIKERNMEMLRKNLLDKFEKAMLKRMGKLVQKS
jgi:O-antigen/teichoic acid export membrane protein